MDHSKGTTTTTTIVVRERVGGRHASRQAGVRADECEGVREINEGERERERA